jgi:hypothetical protein
MFPSTDQGRGWEVEPLITGVHWETDTSVLPHSSALQARHGLGCSFLRALGVLYLLRPVGLSQGGELAAKEEPPQYSERQVLELEARCSKSPRDVAEALLNNS